MVGKVPRMFLFTVCTPRAYEGQKRGIRLENEPRSTGRAATALNHSAISSALQIFFLEAVALQMAYIKNELSVHYASNNI